MAAIKVEHLVPGMILTDEVRDINNRLLCPNGLQIEARHLRLLKMWGIFEVQVGGADEPPSVEIPAGDAESATQRSEELSACFKELDTRHPAIREILNLGIRYRLEHPARPTVKPMRDPAGDGDGVKRDILSSLDRIEIKLPEVPSLVFELNETISDPLSSAGDIARVVNKSPSLAALLLKIVNSAFYGFRSRIDSIPKAVTLIGSREVSNLALGITIMETFKDIPRQIIDVAGFMEHSLACGIVARLLAAYSNVVHTEQLFVSGMLHDIGRLVLCKHFPASARTAFADAIQYDRPLLKSELALLGCTHMQIGKKLLRKWKLPYSLENAVYYHHNPSGSPNPELASLVQVADIVVHALGIGSSGEHRLPAFDARTWDHLRLSPGAFHAVIQQTLHQIETFRKVLDKDNP
jgi:HD-like signal output (HDOD) protein